MKLIDSEEEAEKLKNQFIERLYNENIREANEYISNEINWICKNDIKTYEDCKIYNDILINRNNNKLLLILSPIDIIRGKAQLIHENKQNIPMVRKTQKETGDKLIIKTKFVGDSYDKRFDGFVVDSLSFNFFIYRIIDNLKEYYVFSEKKLPNENCSFKGMNIQVDDRTDINNNLKIKKISTIFIVESFESNIKTLSKENLIEYIKDKEINKDIFHDYLFKHKDNNIYDYTPDFNLLRKAQLLSGKFEGYGLHLFKMGPVGTGKTTEAEVLDYKFCEDQGILEASNSTLKSIIPSFKEKPANLGYICKCNRIAIIDELLKMIEATMGHDNSKISNYFGAMNMLLEQKDRMIGSGNDNSVRVQSTAKISVTTNNIGGRQTIASHLNILDPTTLSRMFVWVQDQEEINKIYDKEDIREYSYGDIMNNDDFLTIFDSCQTFLVDYDKARCKMLFNTITQLCNGKMRDVWRARGLHHTILLLDGIVKHRCLFIDYDNTFTPISSDYDNAEKILLHMVKSWDFNFQQEVDL